MSTSEPYDGIELADAVQVVRDQLISASSRGIGQDVRFEVGEIHMEFTVELRSEDKAGAKIRAWVIDAGAEGSQSNTQTHKVAFTLKPKDARTGGSWQVGNTDPGSTAHFGKKSAN
ncbi:trypco2 family protein [Streptomyces scabiei]|uniref:trypco2 family protein n=1 Tax=Streptomyces scabiei TaxID=1930 RepID=UPI0036A37107